VQVLILMVLAVLAVFVFSFLAAAFRRANHWNRTYERLSKRYAASKGQGGVIYGYLFTRPSLRFDYGRTLCWLRNRKSTRFSTGRKTEISMIWPDRKLRLEVSTSPVNSRTWGPGTMKQVEFLEPAFQADYYVASSSPLVAQRLLNTSVRWQLEQLKRLTREPELSVSLSRGMLVVGKPGYIKDYQQLEDFVRFSLELFDLLMLVDAEGIEFLHADQAAVVADVKCPICSEEILLDMVVCARCKTPHCQDCWEYNGQCATFACSETRSIRVGNVSVN
jgi:hypothetical protein